MVIRNARLGMNSLSVGAWETSWIRNAWRGKGRRRGKEGGERGEERRKEVGYRLI
jgi:hypothetical protein